MTRSVPAPAAPSPTSATSATSATSPTGDAGEGTGRSVGDRFVDLVWIVAALVVALLVAEDAEIAGRVTGDELFLAVVLAGVGCVALWWRRRYPVGVALALVPLAAVSELTGAAVLIAVGTVAMYRRWQVTVAVAAAHALAVVPYSILRPDPELTVPGTNAVGVALLSIAVAVGSVLRSRRELVVSLRERAARAEAEARSRADQLRAEERQRIAREMHDVLAHRISLVSLHAGALEIRPDLSSEEVARAAGTIRASAHQALEDLREILGVLRAGDGVGDAAGPGGFGDGGVRPQPSLADLDELVAECRSAGTTVAVDNRLPAAPAPPSVSRTAYRIVQEALTNAGKHAPGASVWLELDGGPAGELHVHVRNRLAAAGASTIPGARSGLVGLAERVSLAGGRLDHGVRRGADGQVTFDLEAWLPWPT